MQMWYWESTICTKKVFGRNTELSVNYVDKIEKEQSGKYRLTKRLFYGETFIVIIRSTEEFLEDSETTSEQNIENIMSNQ